MQICSPDEIRGKHDKDPGLHPGYNGFGLQRRKIMPRPATRAQRLLQRIVIRLSGGRRLTVTLRPRPRISRALLALLAPLFAQPVLALDPGALPTGGQVVAGQASLQQGANQLTVNQASDKAILNWQSFNIGSAASVQFNQPNANSVALNRVLGNDASQIHGKLSANGQVFISNSNGVLFGAGSQVDVGGLVATTLSLGDSDFMQGRYQLAGDSQASVVNAGQIDAAGGVALVAATVRNDGNIQARDVALAAGSNVSLDLHGDGLLSLKVDTNALRGEVANGGVIQAGNQVIMAAATADALVGSVVNNSGIVRATGISNEGGRIRLGGGLISQTGTLDASAANGGQVEIAAHTLMDAGSTLAQGTTGQGGSIRVEAQQITQTSSASMNVDGSGGGGNIRLEGSANTEGEITSSANLSSRGTGKSALGGDITLSADTIELSSATLNSSGYSGGGTVKIGGGWRGEDAEISNSRIVKVDSESTISANADVIGNGGEIVLFSRGIGDYQGSIYSKGAPDGIGGALETSAKTLTTPSIIDLGGGQGGSWLIDPENIELRAYYVQYGGTSGNYIDTDGNSWYWTNTVNDLDISYPTKSDGFHRGVANISYVADKDIIGLMAGGLASGTTQITLTAGRDINVSVWDALSFTAGSNLTAHAGRDAIINFVATNRFNATYSEFQLVDQGYFNDPVSVIITAGNSATITAGSRNSVIIPATNIPISGVNDGKVPINLVIQAPSASAQNSTTAFGGSITVNQNPPQEPSPPQIPPSEPPVINTAILASIRNAIKNARTAEDLKRVIDQINALKSRIGTESEHPANNLIRDLFSEGFEKLLVALGLPGILAHVAADILDSEEIASGKKEWGLALDLLHEESQKKFMEIYPMPEQTLEDLIKEIRMPTPGPQIRPKY